LHLGGARTALVAWLAARSGGSSFIVRIEDLDQPRVKPGAEANILSDMHWLGLDWDEGPDLGGPHAPYRQSERLALFRDTADRLVKEGKAFHCFCSRAEVARAAEAPHGPSDEGPRYPGTCRELTREQTAAREKSRHPSVRLRVDPQVVEWHDGVHGAQQEDPSQTVGDFVIARADGIPAYQLAVVVDDAAMEIAEVVRGDDLLSSTTRQILLYRALGLSLPAFAHVPLVLGGDGVRLSKRHGDIRVRSRGSSSDVVRMLASSLGLDGDKPHELLRDFALTKLPHTPTTLAL
jgi:glutamyl-tRNA synthetase